MMYNAEYYWMVNQCEQNFMLKTIFLFYLISWNWLHPLWVLHLIHCFFNCTSLLMPTQIEMIHMTLMYVHIEAIL